ncbi:hypothetical protein OC861_006944 [Tilletia horrida]|nr:hypothetical protein OC861_006944 [Tilletia horrida]
MDQERSLRYASSFTKTTIPRQDDRKDQRREAPRMAPRPPITSSMTNRPRSVMPQAQVNITTTPAPFARVAPPTYGRTNNTQSTRPSGAKPTDQCRACGGYGHWASECPKRLRTHAIEVDHSDEHSQNSDDDHKPEIVYFEDETYIKTVDVSNETIDEVNSEDDPQVEQEYNPHDHSDEEDVPYDPTASGPPQGNRNRISSSIGLNLS